MRLTQTQLHRETGIGQAVLSKIELGLRLPTPDEQSTIARALEVPPEFFQRPSSDRFVAVPPLFRLQRKRVAKAALDQLNAEMVTRAMHLREMLKTMDIEPALTLPRALEGLSAEEMADYVRQVWLIRPGPIQNLTRLIEAAGIFVIELDSTVPEFEGCAFRAYNLPSIIFVKKGQPTDRRRFTLAHELAHLILHESLIDEAEREANVFAQALLMPSRTARAVIGMRPRLEHLRRLKREWKISIQAMLMIASRLSLITPTYKTRLFQQLSAYGWRTVEPDELPPEDPELFAEVLDNLRNNLRFTVNEIAAMLKELVSVVERLYGLGPSRDTGGGRLSIV